MSKNINVNPDFYKVGGREHSEASDKGHVYTDHKQELSGHDSAHDSRSEQARAIQQARGKSKKK